MAQISRPFFTACIAWETERPFANVIRKSCDFSFLGDEWWLEARCTDKLMDSYYSIILKRKSYYNAPRRCINITAILELKYRNWDMSFTHFDIPNHSISYSDSPEMILWELPEKSLKEKHVEFISIQTWNIICVFHDIPPPVVKNETVKVDSSTQIDEDASVTVEKSTQVSPDFSDMEKLSEDFSNLLRTSPYPDAKLRCGDRTVPVHRSVLSARSLVFDSMFRNASSSDTFDVTDLDGPTLYLLLEYAYSGTVRELTDDASVVGLYRAGRKYGMDSLRKACSHWMIDHLTPENCVSFLEAASSSDDGLLEEAVASFLCENPDVSKSPELG